MMLSQNTIFGCCNIYVLTKILTVIEFGLIFLEQFIQFFYQTPWWAYLIGIIWLTYLIVEFIGIQKENLQLIIFGCAGRILIGLSFVLVNGFFISGIKWSGLGENTLGWVYVIEDRSPSRRIYSLFTFLGDTTTFILVWLLLDLPTTSLEPIYNLHCSKYWRIKRKVKICRKIILYIHMTCTNTSPSKYIG